MKFFSYKAIDASGVIRQGVMPALNLTDLEDRLGNAQLDLIVGRRSFLKNIGRDPRWSRRELIDFTFHLEQLVTAGIPLHESLCEFRDSAGKTHLTSVVSRLLDAIDNGQSLSDACQSQSLVFDQLYTSMLAVGEQSGRLDEVLSDLAELLKWQDETLSRIKNVLIYPSFVAVVLLVVIIFVMTWLVPGLLSFVTSTGSELPWHTQALVATSEFVSRYWFGVFLLMVLGVVFVRTAISANRNVRKYAHAVFLKAPLIGSILFKIRMARFSRCSALMVSSGISLIDTLKLSESVMDNLVLGDALRSIRHRIIDGETVADSFAKSHHFPPVFSRMMRVGESTGAMDVAFTQTSYFYDRESRESIARLEQFIGPVMIVGVGSVMMWVVISVIGPIYDLVFSMSGQF